MTNTMWSRCLETLYEALNTGRRQGIKGVWFKTLSAIGVYRRVLLLRRSFVKPFEPVFSGVPIAIRTLGVAEIPQIVALREDLSEEVIRTRFVRGDVCLGAHHNAKLVGHVWAGTLEPYSEYVRCPIPRGEREVYLYDAHTIDAMRGNRVSPVLSLELMQQFLDAGYTGAIRATVPENIAALRSHQKLGFQAQGIIGVIALGPWRKIFQRSIG